MRHFLLFYSEGMSTNAGKRATVTSILSSLLLWLVVTVVFMFCSWRKRQLEWQRRAANRQSLYYRYGGTACGSGGGVAHGGGVGEGDGSRTRTPARLGDGGSGQQQQDDEPQQEQAAGSIPPELRVNVSNFLSSFVRPPPEPRFLRSSTPLTPPTPTPAPAAPASRGRQSQQQQQQQQQQTRRPAEQEEEEDEDDVITMSRGAFASMKTFAVRGMTAAARHRRDQQELTSSPELSPPPPRQSPALPPESGYVSQYQQPSAPPAVTHSCKSSYESTRDDYI